MNSAASHLWLFSVLRCALFGVCLLSSATVSADWYYERWEAMGTEITLQMYALDDVEAKQALNAVKEEFARLDKLLSVYVADSEVSLLNRNAADAKVTVSTELFRLLEKALGYSAMTLGAFDITYASVGYLYDLRSRYSPPDWQVNTLKESINYRLVKLDSTENSVRFLAPRVRVDLGGIAKGYAVDQAANILIGRGILDATISAGGDSRVIGRKNGRPWMVGVKHPRQADQHALVLPLENTAVSTSGDYERFYIDENGERQHHILSPVTGRPTKGVQSVTILGERAIDTDALSTAVFVMGLPDGLNLVNALEGYDAIIIDESLKLHYTNGLQAPDL